jgi:hypothetical protein
LARYLSPLSKLQVHLELSTKNSSNLKEALKAPK